jgi:uncharacterized OB-fold protein
LSQTPEILQAEHVLAYDYRRSLGDVLSGFFTALRDRRLVGTRTASGRVLAPPMEHDPDTGEATSGSVDVGPGGRITSWCWVSRPLPSHPLDHPFAFALIRLDGADSDLLHTVDVAAASQLRSGLRVVPRWRAETVGEIRDIECFVPEAGA